MIAAFLTPFATPFFQRFHAQRAVVVVGIVRADDTAGIHTRGIGGREAGSVKHRYLGVFVFLPLGKGICSAETKNAGSYYKNRGWDGVGHGCGKCVKHLMKDRTTRVQYRK